MVSLWSEVTVAMAFTRKSGDTTLTVLRSILMSYFPYCFYTLHTKNNLAQ